MDIQRAREHRELPFAITGPFLLGAVPIEFHTVIVGIAEIKCLAYTMIGSPIQRYPCFDYAL